MAAGLIAAGLMAGRARAGCLSRVDDHWRSGTYGAAWRLLLCQHAGEHARQHRLEWVLIAPGARHRAEQRSELRMSTVGRDVLKVGRLVLLCFLARGELMLHI